MAYKFEYYRDLADRMIDNDLRRNKAFRYYQKMRRMDYELPDTVRAVAGIRKSVDTRPSDAVAKATQIMSSRPPKLTMMPAINNPAGRERANMIERVLKWNLTQIDRRRPVGVVSDVFESAVLYGAVALTLTDLDHQIQVVESEEMQKRLQRARRSGRFVVNTYNPMDVHVRRSSMGVECVLLAQERPAYEVVAEYPMAAKALKASVESGKNVEFFHYLDYETTAIWVRSDGSSDKALMPPTNHDLPFMYWVAMMGGTTLDAQEEHRYRPMLYPVYRSDEWETKNVVDTLMVSDVIWKALAPVIMVQNAADDVAYETGDPLRRVLQLPYGASGAALPQQQVDPALFTISQEFANRMQDSTVSTLMNGGEVASGTSFATLNLATQNALGALKPAKELTEKALAEMFTLMLLWTSYTGIPLGGRMDAKRSPLYAREYVIDPLTIDEENIYINVELDPDEPTDKLQRANTANLLKNLGYSNTSALEDMGVEDPEQEMDRSFEERIDQHMLEMFITTQQQELQMQMQLASQGAQQQMQMGAQQQQMQQQEAQALAMQQQQQGPIQGGQGFDPAMGGLPPAMAFPEGTREEVTGQMGMGGEVV